MKKLLSRIATSTSITLGTCGVLLTIGVTVGAMTVPGTASAATSPITLIQNILVDNSTNANYITIRDNIPNQPACATRQKRMILPNSVANSKIMLATMLTALNAGKRVRIYGTGVCRHDTEIIRMVMILR